MDLRHFIREGYMRSNQQQLQHSLLDTGKPKKTCADVAGRRTFLMLASSQQSGNYSM
jgi:hypothetical protein